MLVLLIAERQFMSNPNTEWFVEGDASTNRILAEQVPNAEECPEMLCVDGEKRNLWRLPAHQVAMLDRERKRLGLKFTVFSRVGQSGVDLSFLYNSPQIRASWKRKSVRVS